MAKALGPDATRKSRMEKVVNLRIFGMRGLDVFIGNTMPTNSARCKRSAVGRAALGLEEDPQR
jgi:hypothetical protein